MGSAPRNLTPAQAAIRLGVTTKALRIYEEHGLIAPGRSQTGWRLYDHQALERARQVVSLRALGLSIAQVRDVLDGDPQVMEASLIARQSHLQRQADQIDSALRTMRGLQGKLARGDRPTIDDLSTVTYSGGGLDVGFDLPWPWDGEWFEMRGCGPLNFITGPLGSGKTRLAQRLAEQTPDASFIGLDRLLAGNAVDRLAHDPELAGRVARTITWLAGDGAEESPALIALVIAIESSPSSVLVVDMVEEGLGEATQQALIACLRANPEPGRTLFLMTRSNAILDLDLTRTNEAIIYCPANHSLPFRAAIHPGGVGHESITTCLASPSVRERGLKPPLQNRPADLHL